MSNRILVITCPPPAGASPAFTAAWLRRQRANATGRCECGAVIEMPNRAQRRAAKAHGELAHATMLHEADCPASDQSLRALYLAGLN
jgi:surfactin synthase thioesterase subunit